MLAQRKLIIPEDALLIEELMAVRKKQELVQTLIKIDRVKGMIETIALRKKFLQHLKQKKLEQEAKTNRDDCKHYAPYSIKNRLTEPL